MYIDGTKLPNKIFKHVICRNGVENENRHTFVTPYEHLYWPVNTSISIVHYFRMSQCVMICSLPFVHISYCVCSRRVGIE